MKSLLFYQLLLLVGIQANKWNLNHYSYYPQHSRRRNIHRHSNNNNNQNSYINIRKILELCCGGDINNTEIIDIGQNEIIETDETNIIIPTSIPPKEEEQWRLKLPLQLQKRLGSLHKILIHVPMETSNSKDENIITTCCELYLLGTAHVSKDSSQDAKLLMEAIKPDVLFVELCHQRLAILEDNDNYQEGVSNDHNNNKSNDHNMINNHEEEKKSVSQMTKDIMDHNPGMSRSAALSSVLLSKIQGDYATKLGVDIGGEFKEAFKVAKIQQKEYIQRLQRIRWQQQTGVWTPNEQDASIHGCAVVLGDRPVRLTLLRTWESLSLFGKVKLFFALLFSSLKQPNEKELKEWIESIMNDPTNDILSKSIEELSRHFPTVKKTIIAERDTYMACKILQTAQVLGEATKQDGKVRKIVAIVGAGHCPGIRKGLDDELSNIANIETTLQSVIETKKHKVHGCPDMTSIVTDIASIDI